MITTKATKYCCGDISKIQNYEKAVMDNKRVWFLFHRNLITGVGRISKNTLKNIGKYYGIRPEELVFLPKDERREVEKQFKKAKLGLHSANVVFQFWSQLYPEKLFKDITKEEYTSIYRSVRRLRILWNQMKARCYNPNAQDFRNYGANGVKVCREWMKDSDNFVLWSLKQGYRYFPEKMKGEQLSIDRIDPTKNYCPSNCRWIPHRENCSRTRRGDWDMILERCYEMARRFPLAADVCWGRARIDWVTVRDKYMDGDTARLVQFLKDNGYTTMTIYKIRKNLGDVIPQKKSERRSDNGNA